MKIYKLVFLLSVIICVSCSKQNQEHVARIQKSSNPDLQWLDNFGIDHNEKMDFVAAHTPNFNISTSQSRWETGRGFIGRFQDKSLPWSSGGEDMLSSVKSMLSDSTLAAEKLIEDTPFSQDHAMYLEQLEGIFIGAGNYAKANSVMKSTATFQSEIDGLISTIYANESVVFDRVSLTTDGGFGAIIGACYIAKYSYAYWYESYYDSNHPWYNFDASASGKKGTMRRGGFWGSIGTAFADAWGFLSCGSCWSLDGGSAIYDLEGACDNAGDVSDAY